MAFKMALRKLMKSVAKRKKVEKQRRSDELEKDGAMPLGQRGNDNLETKQITGLATVELGVHL